MTQPSLHSLFRRSIRCNTGEAIAYHAIMLIHQNALFTLLPRSEYGLIGLAFSAVYLSMPILSLGLDSALGGTASGIWNSCQSCFRWYLTRCAGITVLGAVTLAVVVPLFVSTYTPRWPLSILYLVALVALLEAIRNGIKTILQLTFKNRSHATVELVTIIGYCAMVWSSFFWWGTVTVTQALLPLLTMSILTSIIGIVRIRAWYKTLPEACKQDSPAQYAYLLREQWYALIHRIARELSSGNALVLYATHHIDIATIATLKLASSTLQSTLGMISRIFALPSMALFARNRATTDKEKSHQRRYALKQLYRAAGAIFAFWMVKYAAQGGSISLLIIACVVIQLSNTLATVHESFHLAEARAWKLALANGTAVAAAIPLLLLPIEVPYIAIVGWVALLRVGSLLVIRV